MILMKLGDEYKLYSHDSCIATTHESPYKKLSLKNCQAIENGYDLDELAKKAEIDVFNGFDGLPSDLAKMSANIGFNKGFQKALEILGDNKFSEDDMVKFAMSMISQYQFGNTNIHNRELLKESLPQKTEWDVEICCYIGNGDKESDSFKDPLVTNTGIPKLDADGCLILKRK